MSKKILFSFLFLFLFFPLFSFASTTFETNSPIKENVADFPTSCIGVGCVDGIPNYIFLYRVPIGTKFDRLLMSVPSSQSVISKNEHLYVFSKATSSDWFYSDYNGNSWADNATMNVMLSSSIESKPTDSTYQWLFSTSTIITTNDQYIYFNFDPNTPYADFSYNSTNYNAGASANGWNFIKSYMVPAIKLCDGACDDVDFNAVPSYSPTSWVRMDSPYSGSVYNANDVQRIPLNFTLNTGTTSADKVVVRFSSTKQSITPYDYTIVSTGISSFTYDFSVPAFSDELLINATIYSGTTSLYVSPTYSLVITDSDFINNNFALNTSKEDCEFSFLDMSSWWDCSVAFVYYMFVPTPSMYSNLGLSVKASSTPGFDILMQGYNYTSSFLTYANTGLNNPTTTVDLSIDIPISNATMTLPILSLGTAYNKAKTAFDLFRMVLLASLVLYALSVYIGNLQRWVTRIYYVMKR